MDYALTELIDQVMTARAGHRPMQIAGGGSKHFYGNLHEAADRRAPVVLDLRQLRGVVDYHPSELVITARAGTPLRDIETMLDAQGQMLAFEPPHFGADATLGGCVSSGLAGPGRMRSGGVRDFVLGADLLDAQGRLLSFGGQVVKNVAGYDVSRLLVGAMGVLGVVTQLSIKVVPRPAWQSTLVQTCDAREALRRLAAWRAQPWPFSAAAWVADWAQAGPSDATWRPGEPASSGLEWADSGTLWLRLSGSEVAVEAASRRLGGESVAGEQADAFWSSLREQTHPYFSGADALWRIVVPPARPLMESIVCGVIEWGGAQRWTRSPACAATLRKYAESVHGHATSFRAGAGAAARVDMLHPPDAVALSIMQRLKNEFDPWHLFNPGRLHEEL